MSLPMGSHGSPWAPMSLPMGRPNNNVKPPYCCCCRCISRKKKNVAFCGAAEFSLLNILFVLISFVLESFGNSLVNIDRYDRVHSLDPVGTTVGSGKQSLTAVVLPARFPPHRWIRTCRRQHAATLERTALCCTRGAEIIARLLGQDIDHVVDIHHLASSGQSTYCSICLLALCHVKQQDFELLK